MSCATAIVLLVGLIVGFFYLLARNQKRWYALSRQAAAALGCVTEPEKIKSLTGNFEVHRWQVDGFSVELKTGSQARLEAGTAGVPVVNAIATVGWPKPLPFKLVIGPRRVVDGNLRTGDLDFDGELAVRTDNEAAAARVLKSRELRQELRDLFHSGRSLPTRSAGLDDAAVSVQTFDKKDISASLALALSVARRVSA